ncbi:unnamed protein product [Orchesella dallaii]|uniref:RNA-directed DNA polymerase n=1 Tax=Orchesella dallaii TaxID=48710 RepID=A0ABP1RUU7_9HEXA
MVRTRNQVAEDPNPPSPLPEPPVHRGRRRRARIPNNDAPDTTADLLQTQVGAGLGAQQQLAQQLITLAQTLSMQTSSGQINQQFQGGPRLPTTKHIPPPKLTNPEGMTITLFRDCKQRWNDFSSTQQVEQYPMEAQHGILRAAIDPEWTMLWNSSRLKIKHDSSLREILILMEAYIRQKRNPLLDRQEFHRRDQFNGESVDRYYAALRVLDDACSHEGELRCCRCLTGPVLESLCACGEVFDLEKQMQEIRIRDRFICGLRDKDMLRRVLAEHYGAVLTMEKVLSICTAVESSYAAGVSLGPHPRREPEINLTQSSYKNSSRAVNFQQASGGGHQSSKCKWCGGIRHRYENCPARNAKCNFCKRTGHYEAVCFRKPRTANQALESLADDKVGTGATMSNVTIFKAGKSDNLLPIETPIAAQSYTIMWLPDTGADVDAISIQDIISLGEHAKDQLIPETQEVYAANGSSLGPVGSIHATLNLNHRSYQTVVRVFDKLTTPLLSKKGCIALGLISSEWPHSELETEKNPIGGEENLNIISVGKKELSVTNLPSTEAEEIKEKLLKQLGVAFDDSTLKPMTGAPMKIDLIPDAKPCRRYKTYTIPFHWREQVQQQLDDMKTKGIIEPVPVGESVDWCHPMVIVPKKDTTEPRITVDLTGLNKYLRRPVYPVKVLREVIARIPPGNKYFTTLDARHGYWQVPLDEDSKKLTTFITPWGCFRYCRNVMGLISAGDEHNRRGDDAIRGISNVEKVVEDILIYDEDLKTHTSRVTEVIQRCINHGMTLNAKKFQFARHEVDWCGYRINQDGYTLSPHLVQALNQFPVPKSKTDVRSFCGLVQQFEAFSSRIAELALPIRALLPKNAAFLWDTVHQAAFENIIKEFSSPRILAQFDPKRPVRLETDGAQSKGLGFALWQEQNDNNWKLLQAGSRFVTPTEARYSATEIELLAVAWAVKKCRMFILGQPFELVVDHRPLVPILNAKTLDEIDNPRLQRLKEKLACFRPQVVWRAGKEHIIVDVFSRFPSSEPTPEDNEDSDTPTNFAIILQDPEDGSSILEDPILTSVRDAGIVCSEYSRLQRMIRTGFPDFKEKMDEDLKPYWKIKEELRNEEGIIMWGNRILIPDALRRKVLETLHVSHQGQERTLRRARQAVFWPNISNDIRNLVRGCTECATRLPSQQKEPMLVENPATRPFQCVGVDLFKQAGFEYLAMVDKFSGWLSVAKCGHSANTSRVIHLLKQMMVNVGIPEKLISDNGPQFSSLEFKNWAQKWGILHDPSSPYHPQANGLAESGVKAASSLIAKTSHNGDLSNEAFQLGLMELRNTPRADGRSPAELVFGYPIRTQLPLHRARFAREWRTQMVEADQRARKLKEKAISYYNATAKPLSRLRRGEIVRIQDPCGKEWNRIGEIIDVHPRGRSYTIRTESGRVFWRNRKFLRRYYPEHDPISREEPISRPEPRRSTRPRRAPERFTAYLQQLDPRSNSKGGA